MLNTDGVSYSGQSTVNREVFVSREMKGNAQGIVELESCPFPITNPTSGETYQGENCLLSHHEVPHLRRLYIYCIPKYPKKTTARNPTLKWCSLLFPIVPQLILLSFQAWRGWLWPSLR